MSVRAFRGWLILLATLAATAVATAQPTAPRPTDQRTYDMAVGLLAWQVTWHQPFATHAKDSSRDLLRHVARGRHQWQWANAHKGEPWMLLALSEAERKQLWQDRERIAKALKLKEPYTPVYWRLRDPKHPDVAKAVNLLKRIRDGKLATKARDWLAEIKRNNTVLTFDVAGGYATGKAAPVVMDIRNAERVRFKLYRVRSAHDLLWVASRIGTDFMFRDYGPWHAEQMEKIAALSAELCKEMSRKRLFKVRKPAFRKADLLAGWEVSVAELKTVPAARRVDGDRWDWDDWDDQDDGDSQWFDDRNSRYRDRVRKAYRPHRREGSAWLCDRIVRIPADALKKPGACILVAEANGQRVYVPVIVEPLSLTLRRCRDGVFTMVSNHNGDEPAAGVTVHGLGTKRKQHTDANGVAFLRMFAAGDRAIVISKDGRYAMGGFGELFEGLYASRYELQRNRYGRTYRIRRALRKMQKTVDTAMGHVYADRHVVAAYTDRPTYRPGQTVRFKLIVRELAPPGKATAKRSEIAFRAGDFEMSSRLRVPKTGTQIRFDVLNQRGRVIESGSLTLNDYGTASAKLKLSTEAATGRYNLRVHIAGIDRVVPEVFTVKYYRRPNFEVRIAGVPRVAKDRKQLTVAISGRYYFGKTVASGLAEARLVRPDQWKPLAGGKVRLGEKGKAEIALKLTARIEPGEYFVICDLTDDSGRTVSRSIPCRIERSDRKKVAGNLARLPRFVKHGKTLTVRTGAGEIALLSRETGKTVSFKREAGAKTITIQPPTPGWITLTAGSEQTQIFVYDDLVAPEYAWTLRPLKQHKQTARKHDEPQWVNLTRYDGEKHEEKHDRRWDDAWDHGRFSLHALFDSTHCRVGGRLRILLYVPYRKARILLTIEGRTIADYLVINHKPGDGRYKIVQIPIRKRYLPNFYLRGRILPAEPKRGIRFKRLEQAIAQELREAEEIDDGTEDPRWCRIDVLDPNARPHAQKLDVTVRTDRKQYAPGEIVNATMTVTDPAGQPRAAELSLGAVDASIYSFGEDGVHRLASAFTAPHPQRRYMRKTWRSYVGRRWTRREIAVMRGAAAMLKCVRQMACAQEASQSSMQGLSPSLSALRPPPLSAFGQLPIGTLAAARLRTDFRETATWQPHLLTGKDGIAKATFRLPDSLTAWRLTAVAVTKQTEIGTARSRIRTSLPIICQLFLPRFAVESDRILAVGILRNTTSKNRIIAYAWHVEGAATDAKTTMRGKVNIAAGGSAKLGLWLKTDTPGTVTISLRGGDGQHSDAEERTLNVQALGRPREMTLSGAVAGRKTIDLPKGFTADELIVTLSRSDARAAMEGLGYLVDYPYGCVEQTMSRFLPAVMVAHAAGEVKLNLSEKVRKKLPDVLAKSLARLYNFQHDDGGWGWWKNDKTNQRMTVYVAYGLVRCRRTGVAVDGDVLEKACTFLKDRLWRTHPRKRRLAAELVPRAWLVLALAKRADRKALGKAARIASEKSKDYRGLCNLALACHEARLPLDAKRLWKRVAKWQPENTADLALLLGAQTAFGASAETCHATAARIMAHRVGHRWGNTRATSAAIEAMAGMLGRVKGKVPARRVRIAVAGRVLLDVTNPQHLTEPFYRAKAPRKLLAGVEAAQIELTVGKSDGQPVSYVVSARGTQRLDKIEPLGTSVRIRRRYLTADGKPLTGAVNVGDVIQVRLTCELTASRSYMIIEDRRPAGFEFAGEKVFGKISSAAAHVEFRDDRVCVFHTSLAKGSHELIYYLRAETPGTYNILPGCGYPMYDEKHRGETGSSRLQVSVAISAAAR